MAIEFCVNIGSGNGMLPDGTKFCTCHDSSIAVVTFANSCSNLVASYWITTWVKFPSNLNCEQKNVREMGLWSSSPVSSSVTSLAQGQSNNQWINPEGYGSVSHMNSPKTGEIITTKQLTSKLRTYCWYTNIQTPTSLLMHYFLFVYSFIYLFIYLLLIVS